MKNIKSNPLFIAGIILFFVAAIVISRVLPHAPNFTPIAAIALFLSYIFNRKVGMITIVIGMMVSDFFFIGTHNPVLMAVVYASLAAPALFAPMLRKSLQFDGRLSKALRVVIGALRLGGITASGALFFYLTTNFTVWAIGNMYPHTAAGLLFSYEMALPFLKNNMMGDLFYSGLLFSGYFGLSWLAERAAARKVVAA